MRSLLLVVCALTFAFSGVASSNEETPRSATEYGPMRGMDENGRIPRVEKGSLVDHPERWRYLPESRIPPGGVFDRFLVSSIVFPIVFFNSDVGAGFGADAVVRGRGWVAHQRARIADVVRDIDEAQRIEQGVGLRPPVRNVEAHDRAAGEHLLLRQRELRVAGKERVAHRGQAAFDELSDLERVLALAADAKVQRFEALEHDPRVERRDVRAGVALERKQLAVDELLGARDCTRQHTALPVHHLGCRVGDDVRAEIERALERTGGKRIVDNGGDAVFARKGADELQIDEVHRRVRRAFEEEHLGVGPDRGFPRSVVTRIDGRALDAEAGQQVVDQPAARAERGLGGDDVVPGGKLAEQRGGHRRHAARLRAAGFGAFEEGDAFFEHLHRGVLQARIGHAVVFTGKARGDGGGIVIRVARGEEQGFRGLAHFRTPRAAAHGLRCGAPVGGDRAVLTGGAFHGGRP